MDSTPNETEEAINSEHKALLKPKTQSIQTSYDEDRHNDELDKAIRDLSYKSPKNAIMIKEITPSSSIDLTEQFQDHHYRYPQQYAHECHICTIITCTICVFLVFLTILFIVVLIIIGSIDIQPLDLPHATANLNMTINSKKWSYSNFTNPANHQLSNDIIDSFMNATSMNPALKSIIDINFQQIDPLFGRHLTHHTKVSLLANISSEKAMDKLLSAMVVEKKVNKQIKSNYKSKFLSHLSASLESKIDPNMSVWHPQREFEYPIVCSAKMMVNKMTRGVIISEIKHNHHNSLHDWIHPWKHEDVEPQQMWYIDKTLGTSFITRSIFTHHFILCDMAQRVSHYMDENLKQDNFWQLLNPFKVTIDADTVRCCLAADGNIEHNLPSTQCVGHTGSRQCDKYH